MVREPFAIALAVLMTIPASIYALAVFSQRHRLKSASRRGAEFYPPGDGDEPPLRSPCGPEM